MKVMAITDKPAYYHVPIFRELSEKLNSNFLVLMGHKGQASGYFEKSWNTHLKFDHGLVDGYQYSSLELKDAELRSRFSEKNISKILNVFSNFEPDVVFTNSLQGNFYREILALAKKSGAKIILRSTPNDLGRHIGQRKIPRYLWYRYQYQNVDAVCAVSRLAHDHFLRHGFRESCIFESSYCVDEWVLNQVTDFSVARKAVRERWEIPESAILLCFAGRFISVKRLDLILELSRRFAQREDIYFMLAGDGPEKVDVEKIVVDEALTRVILTGHLGRLEIGSLFCASDLQLLPSDHETYGVVLQEAMGFGCPWVASSHVGAVYDLGRSEGMGEVFNVGDMDEFEKAVCRMLDAPDFPTEIRDKAMNFAKEKSVLAATQGVWHAVLSCIGRTGGFSRPNF